MSSLTSGFTANFQLLTANKLHPQLLDASTTILPNALRDWRTNTRFALRDAKNDFQQQRAQSGDDLEISSWFAYINTALLGGVGFFPNSAIGKPLGGFAIPVFFLDLVRVFVSERYKAINDKIQQMSSKKYSQFEDLFEQSMDDAYRYFQNNSMNTLIQAITQVSDLSQLHELKDGKDTYFYHNYVNDVISSARIFPTGKETRQFVKEGYGQAYNTIHELVTSKELPTKQLILDNKFRTSLVAVEELESLTSLRDMCKAWVNGGYTSSCVDSMKAYQVRSESDYVWLLNNAWLFKIKPVQKREFGLGYQKMEIIKAELIPEAKSALVKPRGLGKNELDSVVKSVHLAAMVEIGKRQRSFKAVS